MRVRLGGVLVVLTSCMTGPQGTPELSLTVTSGLSVRAVATNPDGTVGKGTVTFDSDQGSFSSPSVELDSFGTASAQFLCDTTCTPPYRFTATWPTNGAVVTAATSFSVRRGCSTDANCDPWQTCSMTVCSNKPGLCASSVDCAPGDVCNTAHVCALAPCTDDSSYLTLRGEDGDYIAPGNRTVRGSWRFLNSLDGRVFKNQLWFDVTPKDRPTTWSAAFETKNGVDFASGQAFTGAVRYPFNDTNAGLSISGEGRGCNMLTGSFQVQRAVFEPDGGDIARFSATFEQHCEGAKPRLVGSLYYCRP